FTATSTASEMRGRGLAGSFIGGHLCRAHQAGLRAATTRDAGFGEPSLDYTSIDSLLVSDRALGEAPLDVIGAELSDRVTDIDRVEFSGHVYNFHTGSGTYECGNHIIHNCDCAVAPLVGTHDPGRAINSATLSDSAQQIGVTEGGSPLYRHDGVLDLG